MIAWAFWLGVLGLVYVWAKPKMTRQEWMDRRFARRHRYDR